MEPFILGDALMAAVASSAQAAAELEQECRQTASELRLGTDAEVAAHVASCLAEYGQKADTTPNSGLEQPYLTREKEAAERM